jgi:hypothetical protein
MKITEVTIPSAKSLFESLDKDNNTGFMTEDLVSVVQTALTNEWSQPMTANELLESLK